MSYYSNCKPAICWKMMFHYVAALCLFIFSFQFYDATKPSIRRSATALKPATADVNNVDLITTMQCHAGKLWVQAFMWMPLETHTTHPNTILDQVHAPSWQRQPPMAVVSPLTWLENVPMSDEPLKSRKWTALWAFLVFLSMLWAYLPTAESLDWTFLPCKFESTSPVCHCHGRAPVFFCVLSCLFPFPVSAVTPTSHPPLAPSHGYQPTINPSSTCIPSALASLSPSLHF